MHSNTLICQFYGLYSLLISSNTSNNNNTSKPVNKQLHFVIMQNLAPTHKYIRSVYDLKVTNVLHSVQTIPPILFCWCKYRYNLYIYIYIERERERERERRGSSVWLCDCVWLCVIACDCVWLCACACVCVRVLVRVSVCMCVCLCVCLFVCLWGCNNCMKIHQFAITLITPLKGFGIG